MRIFHLVKLNLQIKKEAKNGPKNNTGLVKKIFDITTTIFFFKTLRKHYKN